MSSLTREWPLPTKELDTFWPTMLCEEIGNCTYSFRDVALVAAVGDYEQVIPLRRVSRDQIESWRVLVEMAEFRRVWNAINNLRVSIATVQRFRYIPDAKKTLRACITELDRSINVYMRAVERKHEKICSVCAKSYVLYNRFTFATFYQARHRSFVRLCDECFPLHTCDEACDKLTISRPANKRRKIESTD